MVTRKIGNLSVSAVGYGCMGLSHGYGATPIKEDSVKLIRTAFELGCNFFDTAEGYAFGQNEELLGEAAAPIRDNVVLATKFGGPKVVGDHLEAQELTQAEIRAHCEESLRRLKTDHIDLYYQHRVSVQVSVEEVAECVGQLIKEGKVLEWGLSQSTAEEIRRAHSVTPLAAVQSEYSMMEREVEKEVLPVCKELGISLVPFSPLASGFLSGKYKAGAEFKGDDVRRFITRFDDDNVRKNQPLLELLDEFALRKNATYAQIALAWLLAKDEHIVPIPGGRNPQRMSENFGAANVIFTPEEFAELESRLNAITIYGNRTDEDIVFHTDKLNS